MLVKSNELFTINVMFFTLIGHNMMWFVERNVYVANMFTIIKKFVSSDFRIVKLMTWKTLCKKLRMIGNS